jgi:hypothetical protein
VATVAAGAGSGFAYWKLRTSPERVSGRAPHTHAVSYYPVRGSAAPNALDPAFPHGQIPSGCSHSRGVCTGEGNGKCSAWVCKLCSNMLMPAPPKPSVARVTDSAGTVARYGQGCFQDWLPAECGRRLTITLTKVGFQLSLRRSKALGIYGDLTTCAVLYCHLEDPESESGVKAMSRQERALLLHETTLRIGFAPV